MAKSKSMSMSMSRVKAFAAARVLFLGCCAVCMTLYLHGSAITSITTGNGTTTNSALLRDDALAMPSSAASWNRSLSSRSHTHTHTHSHSRTHSPPLSEKLMAELPPRETETETVGTKKTDETNNNAPTAPTHNNETATIVAKPDPDDRDALRNDPERGNSNSETAEDDDAKFYDHLRDRYSTRPENMWPQKTHLYEFNPTIAKLPERYRNNELWRSVFAGSDDRTRTRMRMPRYVSTYRVTHWSNCYDTPTTLNLYGGSWSNRQKIEGRDYLGVSLMDDNMNVVLDTTVDLISVVRRTPKVVRRRTRGLDRKVSFAEYDDYRLFNLGEQLYLTSTSSTIPESFVEILPAFGEERNTTGNGTDLNAVALKVWVRDYSSCPVGSFDGIKRGKNAVTRFSALPKNLLYFGASASSDDNHNHNHTARVLYYPRGNPNDVRDVDLNAHCDTTPRVVVTDGQVLHRNDDGRPREGSLVNGL
eukprot:jgi/Psemu1/285708/fgenesh1_pg.100_\